MPQVIETKNIKKEKVNTTKEVKPKSTFKQEWEKAIPIEDAREHLLKKVRSLWKK